MTLTEKMNAVKQKAREDRIHIYKSGWPRGFEYGENPYYDMEIEKVLFYDMFPNDPRDPRAWAGFKRSDYIITLNRTK